MTKYTLYSVHSFLYRVPVALAAVGAWREGGLRDGSPFSVLSDPRRMRDRDLREKRDRLWNLMKAGSRRIGPSHGQIPLIEVIVMVILNYMPVSLMCQTPHFPPSGVMEMIQKEKKMKKEKKNPTKKRRNQRTHYRLPVAVAQKHRPYSVQRTEQKSGH